MTTNRKHGLPRWYSSKESACQCSRRGFNSELGRSPGVGNSNPLQHSCLGNPMDRGAWADYSPWGHKELDTAEHAWAHTENVCTIK